jgi:plastocyanin
VVFADPVTDQVRLASDQSGQFDAAPVNGGQGGANPSIAVAGDGRMAVAWYDTQSGNLDVGTSASGELPLAFSPQPTATPSAGPPAAECEPEGTELAIVALNLQFDKNCLAVEAEQDFTIAFDNQDSGIPHNVELYVEDPLSNPQAQELFVPGNHDPLQGPAQTTYEVDPIADPGSYLFRCFFHPTSMIGTFVVAEAGLAGG